MAQSQLENLVNVPCPLDRAYEQLVPESIQEASKIQRQRRTNPKLRSEWFITGDGPVYNLENDVAVLYFTNTRFNPVLKQENMADAVRQIRGTENYKVKMDDFSEIQKEAKKKNGGATRFVLSELKLTKHSDEWSFYEINTVKYNQLNKVQRQLAEKIHGKGEEFKRTMQMLNKVGISTARIYVLNPNYVKNVIKDGPVARVGGLSGFNGSSNFGACSWDVDYGYVRVRGVRRERVAEGDDAAKTTPFDYGKAYDALLAKPDEALKHLNNKRASGLLDLANKFYQKQ